MKPWSCYAQEKPVKNELYNRLRAVVDELSSIQEEARPAFRAAQRDPTSAAELDKWVAARCAIDIVVLAADHAARLIRGRVEQ